MLKALRALKDAPKRIIFLLIVEGMLLNASFVLTQGIFLSGYIIRIGGDDFLVGMMNSSLNWCLLISIPAIILYKRIRNRRLLLLILNFVSRFMLTAIVLLPLVAKGETLLFAASAMIITGNICWAVYLVGFTVMIVDLVPAEQRNSFMFTRMLSLRIAFSIVAVAMGYLLDHLSKDMTGFYLVFGFSFALGVADMAIIWIVSKYLPAQSSNMSAEGDSFLGPLRNRGFLIYMVFLFLLYFSFSISSSYTPVYLLKHVELSYGFISTMNIFAYLSLILFTPVWKAVEKRIGMINVFIICAFLMAFEFIIYVFISKNTYLLLIPSMILGGAGNSGFNVVSLNYRYAIIPETKRIQYESWNVALIGVAFLLGPIAGNELKHLIPKIDWHILSSNYQILYLISFIFAITLICLIFKGPSRLRLARLESINDSNDISGPNTAAM